LPLTPGRSAFLDEIAPAADHSSFNHSDQAARFQGRATAQSYFGMTLVVFVAGIVFDRTAIQKL
jgi:hypothetical protein